MGLLALIGLLVVVSFLLALWSLRGIRKNIREVEKVRKELTKGRVIFGGEDSRESEHYDDDSSSLSSPPSSKSS